MTAKPTQGHEVPPYKAVLYGSSGLAGVENAHGFNALYFTDKPGAKFASIQRAQQIAGAWNQQARHGIKEQQ